MGNAGSLTFSLGQLGRKDGKEKKSAPTLTIALLQRAERGGQEKMTWS